MLELHIGKLGRDVDRRVHEAERCREDQFGTIQRHLGHHALCVRAFGHGFDEDGFDLVAEFGFDSLTALVMLIGPAAVTDGADIDKAHFQLVLRHGTGGQTQRKGCGGQEFR